MFDRIELVELRAVRYAVLAVLLGVSAAWYVGACFGAPFFELVLDSVGVSVAAVGFALVLFGGVELYQNKDALVRYEVRFKASGNRERLSFAEGGAEELDK